MKRKFPGLHRNELAVRIGGGDGRPLHFFHGDFNSGGLSVPRFAAMLGRNRPVLAIAPHGINGEAVRESIEEMAADRLPLVLNAQPIGPYTLGGHCNGALVAFETARLLVSAGHQVDLVIMIDPVIVSVRRSTKHLLSSLDLIYRALGAKSDIRRQILVRAWLRLAKWDRDLRMEVGPIGFLRRAKRTSRSLWNQSWFDWIDSMRRALLVTLHAGRSLANQSWRVLDSRLRRLGIRLQRALGRSSGEKGAARAVRPKKSKLRRPLGKGWKDDPECMAYSRAMTDYHPSPLGVPVLYAALGFSGRGWRRISTEIEFIDIPQDGHHLNDESGAAIMDRVRARLDALDTFASAPKKRAVQPEFQRSCAP